MVTSLSFQEYDDALLVRATTSQSAWHAAVSAVVAGGIVGLAIHTYTGISGILADPRPVLAVLVAGAVGFVAGKIPSKTELRVSNLDYTSRTFGACGIKKAKSVSRMDVRWLEYHEDTSGPESGQPGGLCAVLKHGSACILPHLSPEQTTEVVERIATKFPAFREQWLSESAFGANVISLGLDRPEAMS